ncbi:class I SAM-dependent rRNA methyltransferase [Jeotgalibacillus soli]|uniref:Putative S-adenosylmethionine-dependent methyltransferase YwbD n=1 Tax=Jeotgalibacillus soli TaxID=889306 RepID=A0A0C2W080_9BACL|nr:class I SAM-dependent rRNA methyltransferase [Jeotgalibacillus soli]KIL49588.1 putative S-adenosylmethionine-dependent methyltransferase YwbD [Jeotgalibacillus soli]
MVNVKIKKRFVEKILGGYPLLTKDMLVNPEQLEKEGEVLVAADERGRFLARGFQGSQNKGVGWLLTWDSEEQVDQRLFSNRLRAALGRRNLWFAKADTTAFRVFNGEGDGIGGLTIDFFDDHYLFTWYSEGIYAFREEILNAFEELADYKSIYEKKRFDTKGQYVADDDFVRGEKPDFPLIVKENGASFAIYLNDGAMVGVFLDQRDVRKAIRDRYAEGKNVLNTFSYTGAFSVFAALGGAVKTTSVDLANRSVAKTIEQFSMNGIDYEAQDILVRDVFRYFDYAVKNKLKFDLVVMDPPSFARSKKHTFSAAKDYKDLMKRAIDVTEDKGIIVASTNAASFNMKKFERFIDEGFKEKGLRYEILESYSLPEDFKTTSAFPEGDYLKVLFVKKK